jgi:hypothetical protein
MQLVSSGSSRRRAVWQPIGLAVWGACGVSLVAALLMNGLNYRNWEQSGALGSPTTPMWISVWAAASWAGVGVGIGIFLAWRLRGFPKNGPGQVSFAVLLAVWAAVVLLGAWWLLGGPGM